MPKKRGKGKPLAVKTNRRIIRALWKFETQALKLRVFPNKGAITNAQHDALNDLVDTVKEKIAAYVRVTQAAGFDPVDLRPIELPKPDVSEENIQSVLNGLLDDFKVRAHLIHDLKPPSEAPPSFKLGNGIIPKDHDRTIIGIDFAAHGLDYNGHDDNLSMTELLEAAQTPEEAKETQDPSKINEALLTRPEDDFIREEEG